MQLPITIILAALSAGALALPSNVIDGTIPPANTSDTRNGLPYSNFNPYNSTLSSEASTPDNHSANHLNNPHHHHHHEHANASTNTTTLFRRTNSYFGDIASYSDGICTLNKTRKFKIGDNMQCQKFAPEKGDFIGINWGGGRLGTMEHLLYFTDLDCNKPAAKNHTIDTPGSLGMSAKGAGTCRRYEDYLRTGGAWQSVYGK